MLYSIYRFTQIALLAGYCTRIGGRDEEEVVGWVGGGEGYEILVNTFWCIYILLLFFSQQCQSNECDMWDLVFPAVDRIQHGSRVDASKGSQSAQYPVELKCPRPRPRSGKK